VSVLSNVLGFTNKMQTGTPSPSYMQYQPTISAHMPQAYQSSLIPNMIPSNTGYFQPNQEHYQTYTQMQNSQQLQHLQQFPQHLQQQIQNQTIHSSQHLHTLSTSEEETENPHNDNTWQVVKRVKRRKTFSDQKQEQL
jgi:hypothetical protein